MHRSIRSKVLLAGACTMLCLTGWGQKAPDSAPSAEPALEVSVLYSPLMSNVVAGSNFWMQGRYRPDPRPVPAWARCRRRYLRIPLRRDEQFIVSASIWSLPPSVRATRGELPRHRYSVYGQALGGVANGMNSIFPASTGTTDSATSLASYVGGGLNAQWTRHVSVRAFEGGWLRTQLPNISSGVQNSLRLGAGVTFRIR